MNDRDKVKYFFRAIFLLGSIPIFVASIYAFSLRVHLIYSGVKTEAIVTKKTMVERPLNNDPRDTYETFELDYSFHASDKQIFRKGAIVSKSQWKSLAEGDKVKILYDRNDPGESVFEFDTGAGGFFKCFVGFVLGLAGIIYSFYFEPKN